MKTIKLTEDAYNTLVNLLTLTEVTDEIKVYDLDADDEVNVTRMINEIKEGFIG